MTDIVCYWSGTWGWVVYAIDSYGNQLWDAQYFPNRQRLKEAFSLYRSGSGQTNADLQITK